MMPFLVETSPARGKRIRPCIAQALVLISILELKQDLELLIYWKGFLVTMPVTVARALYIFAFVIKEMRQGSDTVDRQLHKFLSLDIGIGMSHIWGLKSIETWRWGSITPFRKRILAKEMRHAN